MTALKDVMKVQIHNIDRELMRRFRALCHDEHISQNAMLKEMIREAVGLLPRPLPKNWSDPGKEG